MDLGATLAVALGHHRVGRLDEADQLYRAILSVDPRHADALHLSGVIADTRGEAGRGITLIKQAIAQRAMPTFYYSLGSALLHASHHADAAAAFEQALARGLDTAETLCSLGEVYILLSRWTEAEAACRRALVAQPRHGEAWFLLGTSLYHQERMEEALAACEESLLAAPEGRRAMTCKGHALRAVGRLEESAAVLRRALATGPDDFAAHNNLSLTLEAQGRLDEALELQRSALLLAPGNEHCLYNQGTMLLRCGRFAEGWAGYEYRAGLHPADKVHARFAGRTLWRGEPLDGRRILLTPEQGAGDAIMFARYAPLVAQRGGCVTMAVPPALRRLFQTLGGVSDQIDIDGPDPAVDVYCPLLSLPFVLGTSLATVPAAVPYLQAEPGTLARWSARLPADEPGVRVGLVWAGNPRYYNDRRRSIPFACLAPLLACPGVRWFSLQVGGQAGEAAKHAAIDTLTPALTDFAETAAAIQALDLVISVDTSVAHLAGALGRRVWTLLPHVADWRWLTQRETSPWYPTMRLFRQDERRTWEPVLERVAAELAVLANSATPRAGS